MFLSKVDERDLQDGWNEAKNETGVQPGEYRIFVHCRKRCVRGGVEQECKSSFLGEGSTAAEALTDAEKSLADHDAEWHAGK